MSDPEWVNPAADQRRRAVDEAVAGIGPLLEVLIHDLPAAGTQGSLDDTLVRYLVARAQS